MVLEGAANCRDSGDSSCKRLSEEFFDLSLRTEDNDDPGICSCNGK